MGNEDGLTETEDDEPYVCNGVHNALLCDLTTCSTMKEFLENEISEQGDDLRKQNKVSDPRW